MKINLATIAILFAAAMPAAGQVIVTSGTPDETGNASIFYSNPTFGQILAQQFTLESPTQIGRIETYLGGIGSGVSVQVTTQIGAGTGPEHVLTSFTLDNPGTPANQGIWVGADVSLNLAAGVYYIVYSGTSGGFLPTTAPTDIGPSYFAGQGNGDINFAFPPGSDFLAWGPTTAWGVRIDQLVPVPEPGSVTVATALSLVGFTLWRRSKKLES